MDAATEVGVETAEPVKPRRSKSRKVTCLQSKMKRSLSFTYFKTYLSFFFSMLDSTLLKKKI